MKAIFNKASQALPGATGLVGSLLLSSLLKDTTNIRDSIASVNNMKIDNSSNDSLMNQYKGLPSLDHVNYRDLMGSKKENTMQGIGAAASGAAAGSAFGPIGTGVGAAVGAIGSIFTAGRKKRKAKRKANELNAEIDKANEGLMDKFNTGVESLETTSNLNALANIAANGGEMPIEPSDDYNNPAHSRKKPLSIKEQEDLIIGSRLRNGIKNFKKAAAVGKALVNLHPVAGTVVDLMDAAYDFKNGDNSEGSVSLSGAAGKAVGSASEYSHQSTINAGKKIAKRSKIISPKILGGIAGSIVAIPDLIKDSQEAYDVVTEKNIKSEGGLLTEFNEGGTHEENPLGGVPLGIGANGLPNLVEEGETKRDNYIFSDRILADGGLLKYAGIGHRGNKSFSEVSKGINNLMKERPNDFITKNTVQDNLDKLEDLLETIKQDEDMANTFSKGGGIHIKPSKKGTFTAAAKKHGKSVQGFASQVLHNKENYSPAMLKKANFARNAAGWKHAYGGPFDPQQEFDTLQSYTAPVLPAAKPKGRFGAALGGIESGMRYAPIIGSGIASLTDSMGKTNKPDMRHAQDIENSYSPITTNAIHDYMTYDPLDEEFNKSQMRAGSAATKRAIKEQAGGNRGAAMAGLLSQDYNANKGLGEFARSAKEYNDQKRRQVKEFNRSTNMFNAEQDVRGQMFNAEQRSRTKMAAAEARRLARQESKNNRSANLNNLLNNLGGLGKEAVARKMINSNPALGYEIDRNGNVKYKKQ